MDRESNGRSDGGVESGLNGGVRVVNLTEEWNLMKERMEEWKVELMEALTEKWKKGTSWWKI